jgi:hypothetical protein
MGYMYVPNYVGTSFRTEEKKMDRDQTQQIPN